jgi:uncharacterized protein
MTPFARRGLLLGMALLPAACASSPNPALYTLAMVPGAVRHGAPKTVQLRSIALARYLERAQIVRSSEGYRLDLLGSDWWGEPLEAMLSRVLVQGLSQRLPDSTVFAETGAITATPAATVEVNLLRMDLDASGALLLQAQMAVGPRTAAAEIRVRPDAAGTPALVAAMSQAVGLLADRLAGMLDG